MIRIAATAFTAALAVAVGASSMLVATDADARGGSRVYTQHYEFDRPMHGYEGHVHPGRYCSYKRLPNRKCTPTANGESCRIVGWTLEQNCY